MLTNSSESGVKNEYFEWLYTKVCDDSRDAVTYKKLFNHLNNIEFFPILKRDNNRAEDGKDLRLRFALDYGYSYENIERLFRSKPCSVLEMIISLALRGEEQIMSNDTFGDRTSMWFWTMICNLELINMNDLYYDENYVDMVVSRLINREYDPDGKHGLFYIPNIDTDMRKAEIWYQFMWYLDQMI